MTRARWTIMKFRHRARDARVIVHLRGAVLWTSIDSVGPERALHLSMAESPARSALQSHDFGICWRHSMKSLILLVDDEPAIRKSLAQALEENGYRVLQATNGRDALRMISDNGCEAPDLVISDVMM